MGFSLIVPLAILILKELFLLSFAHRFFFTLVHLTAFLEHFLHFKFSPPSLWPTVPIPTSKAYRILDSHIFHESLSLQPVQAFNS